jgi:hypothetical protein
MHVDLNKSNRPHVVKTQTSTRVGIKGHGSDWPNTDVNMKSSAVVLLACLAVASAQVTKLMEVVFITYSGLCFNKIINNSIFLKTKDHYC